MAEPWAGAVAAVMADPPGDESYAEALLLEQEYLWSDLETARHDALCGGWSMGCDWLTGRIVWLARLTRAVSWEKIQPDLLLDGVYQGILRAAGIAFEEPDMDVIRQVKAAVSGESAP